MNKVIKKGDTIKFTKFDYTNKSGGTGSARKGVRWEFDTKFDGIGVGKVTKLWYDYECGWRFIVELNEATWKIIQDKASKNEAYVSEFDLIPDGV